MITAIVLAKNEAENLKRCFPSLKWCDEIIVIDDYSTDFTAEIAKEYGAKVFRHHLNNDFAQARNFGLNQAKGDWVLFIDADEVVSEELAREVQNAVKAKKIQGYFLRRRDYFGGRLLKHGETASVCLLRLGRKNTGQWHRAVHETWQIKGQTRELKYPLEHYSHPDLDSFLKDISYFAMLHAQSLKQEGKRSSLGRIVFFPPAKFIRNWIFKLGFLDGTAGFVMAMMMSLHSFLASAQLFLLQKNEKHQ